MNRLPMSSLVKRVVALGDDGPVTLYDGEGARRKVSRRNKAAEVRTRKVARASIFALETYVRAHEKSTRKRKDGWLRDYLWNVAKAVRKGWQRGRKA